MPRLQRDQSHRGIFFPWVYENQSHRLTIFFLIKNFAEPLSSVVVRTKAIYYLLASVLVNRGLFYHFF